MDKNTIDGILGRKKRIKNDIKRTVKNICGWFGLFLLVSISINISLSINSFVVNYADIIIKLLITSLLWFYINKEEK